ncbi:hypothetical protein [Crucivirus-495]|nr:hypothetical protein [Crucivirus-495]
MGSLRTFILHLSSSLPLFRISSTITCSKSSDLSQYVAMCPSILCGVLVPYQNNTRLRARKCKNNSPKSRPNNDIHIKFGHLGARDSGRRPMSGNTCEGRVRVHGPV